MKYINIPKANTLISKGAYLIDVRTPLEYSKVNVPKSINIPINKISTILTKFKKNDTLIFVGKSENSDHTQALKYAEQLGYSKIYFSENIENWFTDET